MTPRQTDCRHWCGLGKVTASRDAIDRKALLHLNSIPPYGCSFRYVQVHMATGDGLCNLWDEIDPDRQLYKVQSQFQKIRVCACYCASSALKLVPFQLQATDETDQIHGASQRPPTAVREYLGNGTIVDEFDVSQCHLYVRWIHYHSNFLLD